MCGTMLSGTECTITDMNKLPFPSTNASQTPNPAFGTTKNSGLKKKLENSGSTPTPCLDKAELAQRGDL